MQGAQTEALGIVDDYSVDIRHVDAVFDDCGGYQHVVVVVGEVDNHLLEVFGFHLAVAHHHAGIGHYAVHHLLQVFQPVDVVVHYKHLPVARHLEVDGFAQDVVVEGIHRGKNRITVGWRCVECAEVASAHQRELQRARNGRCAHGERIHIHFHLL